MQSLQERPICSQKIGRMLFRAAMMAMWITHFLIPEEQDGQIRPSTFLLVLRLAGGFECAGACSLSKSLSKLREMVLSKKPGKIAVALPLHFIFRLLHWCFNNLFREMASNQLKNLVPMSSPLLMPRPIRLTRSRCGRCSYPRKVTIFTQPQV